MDLDTHESTELENEPEQQLEGVVRNVDKTKDVMGKRGRIKNIAGRFATQTATGEDEDGTDGAYKSDQPDVERGKAKNMADRFRAQQAHDKDGPATGGGSKPLWMVELESAKEHGVFENEPEVRTDVVHADDEQPDVISVQHTRNLRAMWKEFESDDKKDKEAPRRSDILVRPKKKEPSPEPEPPPPPPVVEEPAPKSRFGAKRYGNSVANFSVSYGQKTPAAAGKAQKEKTPPPAVPEPKVTAGLKGKITPQVQESKPLFKPTLKSVPRKK